MMLYDRKGVHKMKKINEFSIKFLAKSYNESFARSIVGVFASQLDPTVDEISDLKTAVSEAVTNCVVHAYGSKEYEAKENVIEMHCILYDCGIEVTISDKGKGIEDVNLARQALYTTAPESERSGLGFTIMESFTDKISVVSEIGVGTNVTLLKLFKNLQ